MKIIKKIVGAILLLFIITMTIIIAEGYQTFRYAIEETPLADKVAEIQNIAHYTPLSEMPEIYLKAVVAVEDHRFYSHHGVDWISLGNAFLYDVKTKSYAMGGSTITQQLSKNAYFTQEKKLNRKIAEIFMALEWEKNYSKEQVLEFYLNTSYFGEGCYTVREASEKYFQKEPVQMTAYESTLLAGVPNAPSVYAPTVNPDLAKERQRQVIQQMIKYNALTEEEAKTILEENEKTDS